MAAGVAGGPPALEEVHRHSVRLLLGKTLAEEETRSRAAAPAPPSPGAKSRLAAKIEEALWARARGNPAAYWEAYGGLTGALGQPYGPGLDTSLAGALLRGAVSPAQAALPETFGAHRELSERDRVRGKLCAILSAAAETSHPCLADPQAFPGGALALASAIERGGYTWAVRHCEGSEDSYERSWKNPMFVAVYSSRLGAVLANLDPHGTVAQATGGCWLLDRLAAQELQPSQVGVLPEAELCPPAGEACRRQIQLRLEQKVTEKVSSMYRCPSCRARKHTYRQVQIGSADEPSTFMCTCLACGQHFEGRG